MICPDPNCAGLDIPACDWPTHRGRHRLAELRARWATRYRDNPLPTITEPAEGNPYQQAAQLTRYERTHIYGD